MTSATLHVGARPRARGGARNGGARKGDAVLLIGSTGFLGRELLFQLLTRSAAEITCVIRARDQQGATARLHEMVSGLFGDQGWETVRDRVHAVCGDVTAHDLGIDRRTLDRLIRTTTHIIHGAASVRFDLPLTQARRINGQGTLRVLDVARRACRYGRLRRLGYVSTAFVGGRHAHLFSEDDLDVGQSFRNSYEQSKFEAELVVQAAMREVPITVVRPSIIIGDSRSGATSAFNVIYWPLKIYADGLLRYAPADPRLPVDIVPVDFVARGILEAVFRGEPDCTYALAAGDRATEAHVIADMAARVFSTRPPRFLATPVERLVVPWLWPLLSAAPWKPFGGSVRVYLPYFRHGSRFDTSHADALLQPRGIEAPKPAEFLEPVLEFAMSTDFGRDRAMIAARERALRHQRHRALLRASAPRRTRRRTAAPRTEELVRA